MSQIEVSVTDNSFCHRQKFLSQKEFSVTKKCLSQKKVAVKDKSFCHRKEGIVTEQRKENSLLFFDLSEI